ncbi:hypothetical protein DSECCO2_149760 [anaerobic digester metagenome]
MEKIKEEDGFIAALGLNPDDFIVELPDGTLEHDFIAALKVNAKDTWAEEE